MLNKKLYKTRESGQVLISQQNKLFGKRHSCVLVTSATLVCVMTVVYSLFLQPFTQIALISVENKKMEISHKLFTSWLNDLTLIGSEDVIKEILRRNLQKFHSLFCKALGLLQGTFPSMLAPRFVSAATSLIRFVPIFPAGSNHLRFYNGFIEIMRHCEDENEFIRVFLYRFVQTISLSLLHVTCTIFFTALPGHFPGTFSTTIERSLWTC